MQQTNSFIFDQYRFDRKTGVLSLNYAFENGPAFEEKIVFPVPLPNFSDDVADRLFRLVFLLCGISYYKAYVPEYLICRAFALDKQTALWLTKVYELGLAEFAHRNHLNLRGKINFDSEMESLPQSVSLDLPDRVLVPVGGGKDSIVTLETLKSAGMDMTLFALTRANGAAAPTADTIKLSGLASIQVSRTLSPNLFELNKTGVYNGHIPITAIVSTIALTCAVLYGFKSVVMSNERSANVPNFDDVNHQYSKSFEFEQDFARYVHKHVSPDLEYFSFLRPLSEIDIARRFSKLDKYHFAFRSCNTAFKQDEAASGKKWCCDCPKCRFVFLALSPFIEKTKLTDIFGRNMLDDPAQIPGFSELCGLSAHKPFECVGEIEESASVMKHLSQDKSWQNDAVPKTLGAKIVQSDFDTLFEINSDHALPNKYWEILRADRRS